MAKDLTKTASESAIKLIHDGAFGAAADSRLRTTPSGDRTPSDASGRLFRWLAFFTGSKNAMKGFGFFLGGLLLEALGFHAALWVMAAMLFAILVAVVLSLPLLMGRAKASKSAKELFAKNRGVNLLAAARVFLFGVRDI